MPAQAQWEWRPLLLDHPSAHRPVDVLRGIGPARQRALERLDIRTVGDLLLHTPRAYTAYRRCEALAQLAAYDEGEGVCVAGTVARATVRRSASRSHLAIWSVTIEDATGRAEISGFTPFRGRLPAPPWRVGMRACLRAVVRRTGTRRVLTAAESVPEVESHVVPTYPLTQGITQRLLRSWIQAALELLPADDLEPGAPMRDKLPPASQAGVTQIAAALRLIHSPPGMEWAEYGRRLLAWIEVQRLVTARDATVLPLHRPDRPIGGPGPKARRFLAELPFQPTGAQRRAMAEIDADIMDGGSMQRLLSGDVGTGKTLVMAYALLRAVEAGTQGALVVPTRILAEQHTTVLQQLWQGLGVRVALLYGGSTASERAHIAAALREGEIDVVVGTHAVLDADLHFARLGLGVIDEQHRFGVEQRLALGRKGPEHLLIVSATPMPQTMAQALYGAVPVSILDARPPGRVPAATRWVLPTKRDDVLRFVERELQSGGKAFVVCPFIEGDDQSALPGAIEMWRSLRHRFPKRFQPALVHGRMPPDEQHRAIASFAHGETAVLVATSMIEVGIDVPEATVMVIDGAHQFGLAQLHQLRGRVGRGERQGYCFLISDAPTESARARIQALRSLEDGFELAKVDMTLRGPGEFLGVRQWGTPDLRFADLATDLDLFQRALAAREATIPCG